MNYQKLIILLPLALIVSVLFYVGIRPLVEIPEYSLWIDSLITGVLLTGLLILLRNIIQYTHFHTLAIRLQVMIFLALGLLFVVCWFGIGLLLGYSFLPINEWNDILPTLPVKVIIGCLVYTIALLVYYRIYAKPATEIIEEEHDVELPEAEKETIDKPEYLERIAVKSGQKIEVVMVPDIIYLQAEGDYVMIYSEKGKYLKEQTMKSFEMQLPPNKFVRVHRSNIVNVDYIGQIELYNKQNQMLKLKNGTQIKISMSGYKALKDTLGL